MTDTPNIIGCALDALAGRLHILQHALGVDHYGRGEQYRNHFVTGEGSDDHPGCMALFEAGLMKRRANVEMYGGMDAFFVTDAGRAYVAEHSPAPPKLTRGQQRYQDYLDADCCLSFGEWLKVRARQATSAAIGGDPQPRDPSSYEKEADNG